jgi:hypothetical protein
MINRVAYLLFLDTAMLLLVCVLECVALTGLHLHEWFGFALCPLVLLHVVLQWEWFITQFDRMRTTSGWRIRINAFLNLILLLMMSAVLLSGVLVSRLGTTLVGESFGRVRVWSDIHGWLNFVLVVLVGLHLALNWDWIVAACRRRRADRQGSAGAPQQIASTSGTRWSPSFARATGRALAVILIASLAAGIAYQAFAPRTPAHERLPQAQGAGREPKESAEQIAPRPRPPAWSEGLRQLNITTLALVFVVLIGRYVFRLRL